MYTAESTEAFGTEPSEKFLNHKPQRDRQTIALTTVPPLPTLALIIMDGFSRGRSVVASLAHSNDVIGIIATLLICLGLWM